MVYCAVSALPWAGSELSAACAAEMGHLSEAVDAYLVNVQEGGHGSLCVRVCCAYLK